TLTRNQPAEHIEPVHRGARRHDQRGDLVADMGRHADEGVDVIDRVLRKAAVRREPVRAVSFAELPVVEAVVEARGVHALPAALASSAPGVNLHRDAFANDKFVDSGTYLDNRAHVLVTGREVLIERRLAANDSRWTVIDHLEVRSTNCGRVDSHQHLRLAWLGHWFIDERQLTRAAEDPCLHGFHLFSGYIIRFFRIAKGTRVPVRPVASMYIICPLRNTVVYHKEALMKLGRLVRLTVAMLALPLLAYAQDATLGGTVKDNTGGVLPGVTVTATNEASGNTFTSVTDDRGIYRIPVRAGVYKITAELAGFTSVNRPGIELLLGRQVELDLNMQVSSLQETVTVTGEAPLLDTSSSTIASNIDPRQMQDIPINGRNWMDLTMLSAGSRTNASSEVPQDRQGFFQANVDGQSVTLTVCCAQNQPRY